MLSLACVCARVFQGTRWGKKGQPNSSSGNDSYDRAVRPETLNPEV